MMAEEGVRTIAAALPKLMVSPNDTSVRGDLLYGAWLCACCLGATTMGLHHKLCHTLGGLFNLPHAQMHTIILPYVLGFNSAAVPDTMARLGRALNVSDPSCALFELQQVCAAPLALRDIGMPREGIGPAVEQLMANPYKNPRLIEADAIETLLVDAWFGAGILPRPV
jgi:alcohol dehydrogenase class IV